MRWARGSRLSACVAGAVEILLALEVPFGLFVVIVPIGRGTAE